MALIDPLLLDHCAPRRLPVSEPLVEAASTDVGVGDDLMQIPLTGGCQCGKLRYELSETPRMVYCCHWTSCQKITASAFSITAVVIEEAFHLTAGQPHAVQRTADSGRVYAYWVCPDCGSCVTGAPRVAGAFRGVRAGSLDDTSWLRPTAHIWTRSKQPWVVLPDGDRQFETQPDDIAGFLGGAVQSFG